ncbi:hypothetical protein [Candidatus Palauibacter sp.]|uniref:hypothetical protein n=1 Tax=Candidatus Palauibacter sp. TaxID=3101350 RepID=UPI003D10FBC0
MIQPQWHTGDRPDSLLAVADLLRENWLVEVRLAEEYAAARRSDVERLRLEAAEAELLCEGR